MFKAIVLLALLGVASAGNAPAATPIQDPAVSQANAAHAAAGNSVINAISYSQAQASAQAAARDRASLNAQAATLASLNHAGLSHSRSHAPAAYAAAPAYNSPAAPVYVAPRAQAYAPAPVYNAPAPVYNAPAPVYNPAAYQGYGAPAAAYAAAPQGSYAPAGVSARDAAAINAQQAQLAAINAAGEARNVQAQAAIYQYADHRNAQIQAQQAAIAQQAASVLAAPYAQGVPAGVSYAQAPVNYAPAQVARQPLLSYSAVASQAAARDQQAINNAIATQAAIVNAHGLGARPVYNKVH